MAVMGDQVQGAVAGDAGCVGSVECLREPLFARYVESVDQLVAGEDAALPQRVAEAARALVEGGGDWLPEDCCEPGEECYRRHLLYGDPAGRFTVMAVVWRPGQGTPIHGHTAWGAVGVYRGNPCVTTYRYAEGHPPTPTAEHHCCPGDVSHAQAGVAEPHRVVNAGDDIAITIHTYGRDLTVEPASINILL